MLPKKDLVPITAIGAEVGLLFQPIIISLWQDISNACLSLFGFVPPQSFVHVVVFVGFTLLAPTALTVFALLATKVPVLYQAGKFAAVGSSNSFVDIGLLNLAIIITGITKGSSTFGAIATGTALIATINSFFWNKFWTFEAGKTEEKTFIEILKFYAVTGISALVNGSMTWFVVNEIAHGTISDNLWANIAKVIGIFTALLINFLGYKFFVFKKKA